MFKLNALIPELTVLDINKSLNFYLNILQFNIEYERREERFAMLSLNDSQIMIEERNGNWETGSLTYPFGRGINLQIAVNDIDELYKNVIINDYPVKIEIEENWYRADDKLLGLKEFLIMDPDGYLLRFAQDIGEAEL
ncbi:bleomycin resistance protein [Desulfitobacterium metallireducens]|uniref:Bleomycin resistance protein n=1 Tax=Desulfitobacterium metallireducens DSM 15288 TaxID=871968 RepID=W0EDF9_9FIRM|nr:VOC family protein [Desulfitobacterium metallireducens]AHF07111.1 aldoketomutase [Desulfitobacterium metallireducens DSM 15288]